MANKESNLISVVLGEPQHLSDRDMGELLADRLGTRQDAAVSHLEACDDCQSRLESLAEDGVDLPELKGFLGKAAQSTNTLLLDHEDTQVYQSTKWAYATSFLEPSEQPDTLGKFARYEIEDVIGVGGMGVVLKGYDAALNRYSAIKVLSPSLASSSAARSRFSREAKLAAAVVHEHVVPIQTVDEECGLPYFVMPLVEGQSLEQRIAENGPLEIEEILKIAIQIASGLEAAHQQGLVHRDVKPANILLEGNGGRVLITDFGLARAADDARVTQSGVIAGTPQYMSPEQAQGESLDHRSDLFSFGSVLYFMATGNSPFRAESTMGVLRKVVDQLAESMIITNDAVPRWFEGIVSKLLAKHPNDRFHTAAEVGNVLEQWSEQLREPSAKPLQEITGTGIAAAANRNGEEGVRRRSRWLTVIAVLSVPIIVAAIFVIQMGKTLVRFEINDPTLSVKFGDSDITVDNDGAEIRIHPGDKNQFVVSQGGTETIATEFSLKRGSKVAMKISLSSDGQVQISPNSDISINSTPIRNEVVERSTLGLDEFGTGPEDEFDTDMQLLLSVPHRYVALERGPEARDYLPFQFILKRRWFRFAIKDATSRTMAFGVVQRAPLSRVTKEFLARNAVSITLSNQDIEQAKRGLLTQYIFLPKQSGQHWNGHFGRLTMGVVDKASDEATRANLKKQGNELLAVLVLGSKPVDRFEPTATNPISHQTVASPRRADPTIAPVVVTANDLLNRMQEERDLRTQRLLASEISGPVVVWRIVAKSKADSVETCNSLAMNRFGLLRHRLKQLRLDENVLRVSQSKWMAYRDSKVPWRIESFEQSQPFFAFIPLAQVLFEEQFDALTPLARTNFDVDFTVAQSLPSWIGKQVAPDICVEWQVTIVGDGKTEVAAIKANDNELKLLKQHVTQAGFKADIELVENPITITHYESTDPKTAASFSYRRTVRFTQQETKHFQELASRFSKRQSNHFRFDFRFVEKSIAETPVATDVRVFEIQHVRDIAANYGVLQQLAFSPDGNRIIASGDRFVQSADIQTGEFVHRFAGHKESVTCLAISNDGKLIVSGSKDKTVRLWNAETGKQVRQFNDGFIGFGGQPTAEMNSVAFMWGSALVVSTEAGPIVRRWNVETGEWVNVFRIRHLKNCRAIVPSPHMRWCTIVGEPDTSEVTAQISFYEIDSGLKRIAYGAHDSSARVTTAAYAPDGSRLITGGTDNTARVWDPSNGKLSQIISVGPAVRSIRQAFEQAASAVNYEVPEVLRLDFGQADDGLPLDSMEFEARCGRDWIRIVHKPKASGSRLMSNSAASTEVVDAVLLDSQYALTLNNNELLQIWDVGHGKLVCEAFGSDSGVRDLAVSPDRQWIVTCGEDCVIRLWSLKLPARTQRLGQQGGVVQ